MKLKLNSKNFLLNKKVHLISLLLIVLFPTILFSQETVVVGQVLNKFDRSPLASVSVYFKGTAVQTETNEEGYFLIRNKGTESNLVFSLIGYEKFTLKINPGESVGTEILMDEKINILGEMLVTPGANPANDLMKRVHINRKQNNVKIGLQNQEQVAVFLSKKEARWENNRLFDQLKVGNVSHSDSSLLIPLYLEESSYALSADDKKLISKNTFDLPDESVNIVSGLVRGMETDLNFYSNSVSVLGKSLISPLASVGKSFYRYYITDSIYSENGKKEYNVIFRSKNTKNLAFNGELRIDSATLSLTYINAELPKQANLNFIHNLRINQSFENIGDYWVPKRENSAWNLTYELFNKEKQKSSELFVTKRNDFALVNNELIVESDSFANSDYVLKELQERMDAVLQTPLYKTASYIANTAMSGYFKVGFIDIGQIIDITRLTKIEGVRVGLPFRTNEKLMKNVILTLHPAYGFRDKEWKYSGNIQLKIPYFSQRLIAGAGYFNDYRRIDYDYNNYLWREDPLASGDENFVTTFFAFTAQHRMSKRNEISAFIYNDWSENIESKWVFRDITYWENELLPLSKSGVSYDALNTKTGSFTTRFSFGEKTIDKHFQRFYLKSLRPVIYATVDAGKYYYGNKEGNFGRISTTFLHKGQFMLGEWRYMIDAGKVLGDVPYPLLKFIQGKEGGAYNRFEFALMNNREYIADTYGTFFSELILNGIVFNRIPLIKHLNLREIVTFKAAYGTLSDSHSKLMDIPTVSSTFQQPYTEASVGFCNLLGVMSVQSIWRLSDLNKPNIQKWGIKFNIMLTF
jgi:hypothetical protein